MEKDFHLVFTKTRVALFYKKKFICQGSMRGVIPPSLPKKVVKKKADKSKPLQFLKFYNKQRKLFYRNNKMKDYTATDKNFKHIIGAVEIMNNHDAKFKLFMKAQIEGLKFVGEGKGIFPKINQLDTIQAEERLLKYIDESPNRFNFIVEDWEKDLSLTQNEKFKEAHDMVLAEVADLETARYVRKLMMLRLKKVDPEIITYIKKLKKEA